MGTISKILSGLLGIGVNLTGRQYEMLKWRMSPQAQKYYTAKENKDFYKNLKKGNLAVVDAIRKEKQMRIKALKQRLLSIIVLSLCLFNFGCISPPKDYEQAWDVNSLKVEERTFEIKEQTIKVTGKLKAVSFDDGWYVVSADHIKTFNENQDTLLSALSKVEFVNKRLSIMHMLAGAFSMATLICVIVILSRRKK